MGVSMTLFQPAGQLATGRCSAPSSTRWIGRLQVPAPGLLQSQATAWPSSGRRGCRSSRRRALVAARRVAAAAGGEAAAATAAATAPEEQPPALPPGFQMASSCGRFRVRPVDRNSQAELRRVVAIQGNAFYEKGPLPFLDNTFKTFFVAEVLSELQKKVKFNPTERFVMLVAEAGEAAAKAGAAAAASGGVRDGADSGAEIIGVVEVSYLNEKEVLKSLGPEAEAFAYIASMAVDERWQRQGVASTLLQAAEHIADVWKEPHPVLHVYQDNQPAIQLYKRNSYDVIFQDGPWWARLGVRPRFLMQKQRD